MVRPTRFEIAEGAEGEARIIWVAGELDLSTVPALTHRVDSQVGENLTTLTLDLSDLTFMDSSGLRLLIELDQRAQRETWKLVLIPSKHESANTVLRVTGADRALPFETPSSS
jgi:anti-sigma B factor antagonist